jgi:ammonia channel protein AmtB
LAHSESGLVPRLQTIDLMIDKGDTAWILVCSALVLLMTVPGLALFHGGMVRQRNVLATLLQSFAALCVVSLQWILFGYSLSFGPDKFGGFIGDLSWAGLRGVGPGPYAAYAATIPHQAFMLFQMMFAAITPALICGAFAERMKFSAFLLFTLLWFDWFGFNAGSALEASGIAANAFLSTHAAAAAAGLGWMSCEWKLRGKPTALGTAYGVGGTFGAMATGLFAWKAINAAGGDGLFHGNASQLTTQFIAIGATILLSAPATYLILKLVNATVGLRVTDEDEDVGLDLSQHSERAYAIGDTPMGEHVLAHSEMPSEAMVPQLGKPVAQ